VHIVVTMAGLGSRFRAKGYPAPKYAIEVRGRTMFAWAMESLRNFLPGATATFVVRAEDRAEDFVRREIRPFGAGEPALVTLDHVTDGQATTVLLALPALRKREPTGALLVYNIDTYVEPAFLHPRDVRGDGWIPCFPGVGDAWSFFRTDEHDRVVEAREKVRISDHASIGLYHFSSLDLYEETYRAFYEAGTPRDVRERYVAPLYQHLVQTGRPLWIHRVPAHAVHPLGTPEEAEAFAREA
jgi:NDP-sugar pyrophosphorylase family protein